MFNSLFTSIVEQNLRKDFRQPVMLAIIQALLYPIYALSEIFTEFKNFGLYKASHTGQVIYLEHFLNDYLNFNDPVVIIDSANVAYTYIANKSEGYEPLYLANKSENEDPFYLANKSEYANLYDFIVQVSALDYADLLADDESKMKAVKAIINMYKPAGKRYKIESL